MKYLGTGWVLSELSRIYLAPPTLTSKPHLFHLTLVPRLTLT